MGTIVKDEPREADEARRSGKLAGRVALVTGGNRGIGAAICRSRAGSPCTSR